MRNVYEQHARQPQPRAAPSVLVSSQKTTNDSTNTQSVESRQKNRVVHRSLQPCSVVFEHHAVGASAESQTLAHRSTALPALVSHAGHPPESRQFHPLKGASRVPPAKASVLPSQTSDRETSL